MNEEFSNDCYRCKGSCIDPDDYDWENMSEDQYDQLMADPAPRPCTKCEGTGSESYIKDRNDRY